jgi:hypothetical protein
LFGVHGNSFHVRGFRIELLTPETPTPYNCSAARVHAAPWLPNPGHFLTTCNSLALPPAKAGQQILQNLFQHPRSTRHGQVFSYP